MRKDKSTEKDNVGNMITPLDDEIKPSVRNHFQQPN